MNQFETARTAPALNETLLLLVAELGTTANRRSVPKMLEQVDGPAAVLELQTAIRDVLSNGALRTFLRCLPRYCLELDSRPESPPADGISSLEIRLKDGNPNGQLELRHEYWDYRMVYAETLSLADARFFAERWNLNAVKLITLINGKAEAIKRERLGEHV